MAEQKQQSKFPSEEVELPSGGRLYPKDSPLSSGKIELKYMTAREEDILTSQNLIKKGVVIERLLDSIILTKGVKSRDLLVGDKNAVMVAARILAYGGEYAAEIVNPEDGEKFTYTFDLTECQFKELPESVIYSKNEFELQLPITKSTITFKLITGVDEEKINLELKSLKKIGTSAEVTTRLKNTITSVNSDNSVSVINEFVDNMLAKESLFLREHISDISPDINLTQEIEMGGETVTVDIPMTVNFFWPNARI